MDKKKSTRKDSKNTTKEKTTITRKKKEPVKNNDSIEKEFISQKKNYVVFIASVAVILVGVILCVFLPKMFVEKEEVDDMDAFEIKEIKFVDKEISTTDNRFYPLYQILKKYTYFKSRDEGASSFSDKELAEISFYDIKNEDFVLLDKISSNGSPLYQVSITKLLSNLERYFGDKVPLTIKNYEGNSYNVNNNTGMIESCDEINNTCEVVFSNVAVNNVQTPKMVTRKIVAAKIREESEIFAKEKVIYVERDQNDFYTFHVYSDPNHKKLIETKCYTQDELATETIDIEDYIDSAGTIFYNFIKKPDGTYYFYSSDIQ